MKVILLERVDRLGTLGEIVNVKDGFARNFLLPRHKALRGRGRSPLEEKTLFFLFVVVVVGSRRPPRLPGRGSRQEEG